MQYNPNKHLDQAASISPMAALVLTATIGFGALSVDVGSFYFNRRALQGAADLAALAAAEAISPGYTLAANQQIAQSAAAAVVLANGYSAATLTGVTIGHYDADPTMTPANRFVAPTSSTVNGVRVTLSLYTPMLLGRFFVPSGTTGLHASDVRIDVSTTAANAHFASFDVGTTLATLQGGLPNALLSSLIGSNVSLSAMSYTSLLNTQIDLFAFSKALAGRINLTGPTYDSLFNTQVKVSDVLAAMAAANSAAQGSNATATSALLQLAGLAAQSSTTVQLSRLIDFGPFTQMNVDGTPLIGASVSAYDLLSETLGIANGNHMISANLGASIPGLAAANVYLTVGERPVGSPWLSVGPETTTVHTAQTRLLILSTIGAPPLLTINLPIYVEIASASATLKNLTCEPLSAVVNTTPAIVNAWIGNVTPTLMANTSSIPNPAPAQIASVLGIGAVTARANAGMTNLTPTSLAFAQSDITSGTVHTARTVDYTTSLVTNLLSSLQLGIAGVPLIPPSLLTSISQALASATSPLDGLINSVLATLGISLGTADVRVTGVRCDGAVLVQ